MCSNVQIQQLNGPYMILQEIFELKHVYCVFYTELSFNENCCHIRIWTLDNQYLVKVSFGTGC